MDILLIIVLVLSIFVLIQLIRLIQMQPHQQDNEASGVLSEHSSDDHQKVEEAQNVF